MKNSNRESTNPTCAKLNCFSPRHPETDDNESLEDDGNRSRSSSPISDVTKADSRFLSTGFTLIGYTFLLQLGLHLMTFFLNALAYRRLDTTSIGLVNLRIGLFYTTLMFVARDALRRAFLSRGGELVTSTKSAGTTKVGSTHRPKDSTSGNNHLANLIDSAWTVLPLGLAVGSLLLFVWIWILPAPGTLVTLYDETTVSAQILQRRYVYCLLVYAISGLFELATEPFWLTCQLSHFVRERILIEALANATRAFGVVIAIFTLDPKYAIYSLAVPQILHGSTLFVAYVAYFYNYFTRSSERNGRRLEGVETFRDLFPRTEGFAVDKPAMMLAKNLFAQGLLKQLLTEGERYLISGFHLLSFSDQAIYDLVNNLGSIATRLLFLPMEESCHFVFNQCLNRELQPDQQDKVLLKNVFRMLRTVLRVCSLTAWIGLTFAQANSRLLLFVYAGHALSQNPMASGLLRWYAAYVLLLAWNGSTEAFLNAAMSVVEITKHNERLITFSVIFLCANWFFVPWLGARGFLLANSINMFCRIYYSCSYIHRFTRAIPSNRDNAKPTTSTTDHPTRDFHLFKLMVPSKRESLMLLVSLVVTLVSESLLCCDSGVLPAAYHAMVTTIMVLCTLFVFYLEERDLIDIVRTEVLHLKPE